jgi:hypothetical protein
VREREWGEMAERVERAQIERKKKNKEQYWETEEEQKGGGFANTKLRPRRLHKY